jgi:hypothetical protein
VLQKSFCITDCKFSGPYVRPSNNHLRDYDRQLEGDRRIRHVTQRALLRLSSRIALWIAVGTHSLWMEPTIGYANIFGPISPLISMILSAGTLFLRAAARIASGLGAS